MFGVWMGTLGTQYLGDPFPELEVHFHVGSVLSSPVCSYSRPRASAVPTSTAHWTRLPAKSTLPNLPMANARCCW